VRYSYPNCASMAEKRMKRFGSSALVLVLPLLLAAESPVLKSAAPAPDVDALFAQNEGRIGGDGAYSVTISSKRKIWLFSDSWVGKVHDGKRTDATIVNNTIGVQDSPTSHLKYTIAHSNDGKPAAFVVPADGHGWYWLQAAIADRNRLSFFLNQIERTDDKG